MKNILIVVAGYDKNVSLAKRYEDFYQSKDLETKTINLIDLELPLYTPKKESEGKPDEKIDQVVEELEKVEKILIVSPEYNGGIPPVITNLFAWLCRVNPDDWRKPLNNKKVLIASHTGSGGVRMIGALREQLSYIGLNTIGRVLIERGEESSDQKELEEHASLFID